MAGLFIELYLSEDMMIQQLPTIGDIQTTELLYYDAGHSQECYDFCKKRDIDCLPDAADQGKYYQLNSDVEGFDEMDITDKPRLDAATYIFEPGLVTRFRKSAVQFVYTNGVLTGVVHFSDYNHAAVYVYLYAELARYERDLRDLLVLNGLKNENMLSCFQEKVDKYQEKPEKKETVEIYKRKISDYEKKREKLAKVPELQGFNLNDLHMLAQGVIKLSNIGDLRNAVMHSRDSIEQRDASVSDYMYEAESFETFFDLVQTLLTDHRRVRTRLLLNSGQATDSAPPPTVG